MKETKEPDYIQYCCESDLEHEYPRRTKEQKKKVAPEVHLLRYGMTIEEANKIRRNKQKSF